MLSRFRRLGLAVALFGVLASAGARSAHASDWEFVIAPYFLAPSITGETGIGRAGQAPVDVEANDIFESLTLGGMIHAEARHVSGFGVMLDYSFMKLNDGFEGKRVTADAEIFQGVFEAYGSYRLTADANVFDLYGGVRVWDIDADTDVTVGPLTQSFSNGDTWADPVIGVRWQRRIAPKWRVSVQGDIGGFSIGNASRFTWNAMGGVAYDGWENVSLFAFYRALSVDYSTGTAGTASYFSYDTITQGPVVGAGFRF